MTDRRAYGTGSLIEKHARGSGARARRTGAAPMKARSLMVHDDPASQRKDLLRLLGLIEDPQAAAENLLPTERRWLLVAEAHLDLEGPSSLSAAEMTSARLAFRFSRVPTRETGGSDSAPGELALRGRGSLHRGAVPQEQRDLADERVAPALGPF